MSKYLLRMSMSMSRHLIVHQICSFGAPFVIFVICLFVLFGISLFGFDGRI